MSFTDSFKRQHSEILDKAGEISALLEVEKLKDSSQEVLALLASLAGKLEAHLTMEDKVLYPKLYEHRDEQVGSTAKKFFDEMGGLSSVFQAYCSKWDNDKIIQDEAQEFIDETKNLFSALANRIDREDNELYPLAD